MFCNVVEGRLALSSGSISDEYKVRDVTPYGSSLQDNARRMYLSINLGQLNQKNDWLRAGRPALNSR
jgi:hypothetical protein